MRPRRVRLGALVALALLAGIATGPVHAHESDPRIVTTLDKVEPALPARVVVQVQPGIATQLVAANPTPTVLEVIGSGGRPFLRMSSAGVFADLGTEEFFTTSNPNGAAPSGTTDTAPRWVRISAGSSWGWYDHRLHPEELVAPPDAQREVALGTFEVPFRYGSSDVVARGTVRFRPLLGSFQVSADQAPSGLSVQALPGRLPALFLTAEPGADVTVLGRDGEPFLRITEAGVAVNERSRTHVEDRQARGEVVPPPAPTPAFRLVAPDARSYTWLDARLRYDADLPPEPALRAAEPTRVEQWSVPVRLQGQPAALTGDITWVPEADAAARVSGRSAGDGSSAVPVVLVGAAAVLVLAGAVLALRRRGRAAD